MWLAFAEDNGESDSQPALGSLREAAHLENKDANLRNARSKVLQASSAGAHMVVLPECFNSPYGTQHFAAYAEPVPGGPTTQALCALAKEANVCLVGGSIPERDVATGKLFNTCLLHDAQGRLLAKHRKLHLFDIDHPNMKFKESDALTAGDSHTIVDTAFGKIGIGICYDIRFPELAMVAARHGALAMIYPGAFNMVTGPMHWELLARARAVDNQMFVAVCSPARDNGAGYVAWGHSSVVAPSGKVLARAEEAETIVYADIAPAEMESMRAAIPVASQRRFDLYPDVSAFEGS